MKYHFSRVMEKRALKNVLEAESKLNQPGKGAQFASAKEDDE
jgi:hypothetical protein